jgi:hypothetical protein
MDDPRRHRSRAAPISHFGKTKLELTSFLFGTGPGLGRNVKKPLVVDILPTVLHQLGLATPRSWNIDGHTLSHAKPPSSASARLRGHRLTAHLRLGSRPRTRAVTFHLPAGVTGPGRIVVNGKPVRTLSVGRKVTASFAARQLRSTSLTVSVGRSHSGSLGATLRGVGTLVIPLS